MWICSNNVTVVYTLKLSFSLKWNVIWSKHCCVWQARWRKKTPPIYTQRMTELCIIAHTLARCSNHVRFLYVAGECLERMGMRDWATLVHSVWNIQIEEILGLSLVSLDFVWKLIFSFLLWNLRDCYSLPNSKIVQLKFPVLFFFDLVFGTKLIPL